MSMSVVISHANSAHSAAGADEAELRPMKHESVLVTSTEGEPFSGNIALPVAPPGKSFTHQESNNPPFFMYPTVLFRGM